MESPAALALVIMVTGPGILGCPRVFAWWGLPKHWEAAVTR